MLHLPPEDQLRALLRLIYIAMVEARAEARQGESESEGTPKKRFTRIAELLNSVHNIPCGLTKDGPWSSRPLELRRGNEQTAIERWLQKVYSDELQRAHEQIKDGAPP